MLRFALPFLILLIAPMVAPLPAQAWEFGRKNVPDFQPAFEHQTRAPKQDSGVDLRVEVVADGLAHPWGVAVMPDGRLLVTERGGALRIVTMDGSKSAPITGVPKVFARGQGGLLDVALAADFAQSRVIYLTYAKPVAGGSATAAARAVLSLDGTALTDLRDIFVQSPASPTAKHYGSRIVIDGAQAWVTTGEHSSRAERGFAQDMDKTYGKVMRVPLDGGAPEIWSLGHRNMQGAALSPDGTLWGLEHGPKGGDELNLIRKGGNYGWPVVSYGETYGGAPIGSAAPRAQGMEEPVYYWDPVIAPGNMLFYQGDMFPEWRGDILAASLNPGGMVRLDMDGTRVAGEERFRMGQGRIRDLAVLADGSVLALMDARGGGILRFSR